jgi:hypothetical protein
VEQDIDFAVLILYLYGQVANVAILLPSTEELTTKGD